ncbi:glutamate--cysteine ligase [Arthrobacter sp. AL08]|uniref:glutamate--cysteine ligase n=1 Tax=Micrococcaceae TaxID=1268 RepID=UPI001CFF668A|nr:MULTISPECIES: glutamate--cysteine ligase [Micrococcaceae]MCB5281344.1 putative glutamate--cysteine ligase 2 [Arthrobacter sp. ES1]MDD1476856.1 glutamate--cysteine ligase [Arthrobacter sp. H16F315]MDI3241393.1 glutamate--cysteine ligase [Arthrobacter sp. AL05]MDI3277350.1 glutamate--cysteine ligase [Arthrobacter sp. AL08]MDJ0352861.1 glutamate--cysteine ligase [Pseudarthrobacter sp. PH31-O2]
MKIDFASSRQSTLGVEWELALVDAETGELASVAKEVLRGVAARHPELNEDDEHPHIKQELLLNTVELVTGICNTVAEAKADLTSSLAAVREVTDPMGVEIFCAGSHPFSPPQLQPVTDKERYAKLIDRTQWWGRQMVIYGVHVHVGLDSRDKVLPVLDGLVNYFPHFQALSASSPFWGGEDTGYASQRALMFQQLPTAGLPFQFANWADFESYAQDMSTTGVIDSLSEIRWDIRPVPHFGTIEMRICDGLATLEEVGAVAALTQCLVDEFSTTLDNGGTIPTMPPWHVQENKWRAARYGLDAIIILDAEGNEQLVTDHIRETVARLRPVAEKLGCAAELADVLKIVERGAGYQRQRRVAAEHGGDLRAVVLDLVQQMRQGPEA